jgi:hypothetical protein
VRALRSCSSRTPALRLSFSSPGIRELPAARERRQLLEAVEAEFGLVGRAHRIPQIARGCCSHVQRLLAAPPALQLPHPQITGPSPRASTLLHDRHTTVSANSTRISPASTGPSTVRLRPTRQIYPAACTLTPENRRPGTYNHCRSIVAVSPLEARKALPIASRAKKNTHSEKRSAR